MTTAIETKIHTNPDETTVEVPASVEIGDYVTIKPGATIGEYVTVGEGSTIADGANLGKATTIGANTEIHAGVTTGHAVSIGNMFGSTEGQHSTTAQKLAIKWRSAPMLRLNTTSESPYASVSLATGLFQQGSSLTPVSFSSSRSIHRPARNGNTPSRGGVFLIIGKQGQRLYSQ